MPMVRKVADRPDSLNICNIPSFLGDMRDKEPAGLVEMVRLYDDKATDGVQLEYKNIWNSVQSEVSHLMCKQNTPFKQTQK